MSTIDETLADIDRELLEVEPLARSGRGVDDPEFGRQSQRLEKLQERLSLALKELQSKGTGRGKKTSRMVHEIRKRLAEAGERALGRDPFEVGAEGIENVHEYLEKLNSLDHSYQYHQAYIIPSNAYHGISEQLHAGDSVEIALVFLWAILAKCVQDRKNATRNST